MHVHAGTVVAHKRLGHEGRRFTVGVCHVVYTILKDLDFVRLFYQRVELDADLALAGSAYFVVVHFNAQSHLLHRGAHGCADVVQ